MKLIIVKYKLLSLLTVAYCFILACNDPTFIGADLVEEDAIKVEFTDKIQLRTSTVRSDTVQVFAPDVNQQLRAYLLGNFQDPYFGLTSAEIYTQFGIQSANPDFNNITVDSLILVLPYDTTATYGVTNQTYEFEVLRVTEQLNRTKTYYSDQTFVTDPTPLGSIATTLKPLKVDSIISYSSTGVPGKTAVRQLRIPLNQTFAQELIQVAPSFYATDSTFVNYLPGINIRSTSTNAGIGAFRLLQRISSDGTLLLPEQPGMVLYYSDNDTLRQFIFPIFRSANVKTVHLEHDYSGAPVESLVNNPEVGDSLVFVQGAAGLNVKVDFPDLSEYQGMVVNKAVLEFTVADLSTDGADVYPPIQQLLALYRTSSGNLFVLPEITNAVLSNKDFTRSFGGTVTRTKDGKGWLYRLNISTHFQDILDGTAPATIYVQAYPSAERASRVGLFGAGTAESTRAKLQLTFTRL